MRSNKTLIVIPARLDSKRLPQKILADIHGKPMIYWVAKRILSAALADVIVATDSDEIMRVCVQHSLPVTMTSKDCANGTERVYEVSKKFHDVDFFLNIQGDEPLIDIKIVKQMLAFKPDKHIFYTAISRCSSENNNPSEVKVAMDACGRIRFASRAAIPFYRDAPGPRYKIHGVYLYCRDVLSKYVNSPQGLIETLESVEQLRCIENDIPLYGVNVIGTERSVDTDEDLKYMRSLPASMFDFDSN